MGNKKNLEQDILFGQRFQIIFLLWIFCEMLLDKAGVLVTPGVGFGSHGEGYIRISLNVEEEELHAAVQAISKNFYVY